MRVYKQSIFLIFISLAILGCVYTQITIPLKLDQSGQLYFSSTLGMECEIDLYPSISYCTNYINQPTQNCKGVKIIGKSYYTSGEDQKALFKLGNSLAYLTYTVPRGYHESNVICFIWEGQYEGMYSALEQLYEDKEIKESSVYISLDSKQNQNGFIGELNIGTPNKSFIKMGTQMVQLSRRGIDYPFHTYSNADLKFFGQKLDCPNNVQFQMDPFSYLSYKAFDNILSILSKQGIQYTYFENQKHKVLLSSIIKLQPITITFVQDNDTLFPITIKPSQFTRKLADGQYELLIKPDSISNSKNGSIAFGQSFFETYYVGFNIKSRAILIAQKEENKVLSFLDSSNISD